MADPGLQSSSLDGVQRSRWFRRTLKACIPPAFRNLLRRNFLAIPPAALVSYGSLGRLSPISREWGFDRGLPVDRYYIEGFLRQNAGPIAGRVLEMGDRNYTRTFGGDRVRCSDVLHVREGNPEATFTGDLTEGAGLPADAFDCIVFTQTLNFIWDTEAAVGHLHRVLKPGGVLLATVAGISKFSRADSEQWGDFWRFNHVSLGRLLEENGQWRRLEVGSYGNVFAAVAFLHGLCAEEIDRSKLDYRDPDFQVIITARAEKA